MSIRARCAQGMARLPLWLVCGMTGVALATWGQDTRKVTEPVIPAACLKLEAKIVAAGETLIEADEARPDSARIQEAIDEFAAKCKPGMAIELAPGEEHTLRAIISAVHVPS